jgi:hypothetical protein
MQVWLASVITTASSDQVEDQNNQRYYQQNMNEAAGNVKAESQEPQNQKNYKNRPKHKSSFVALRAHESFFLSQAPASNHC